MNRDEFRELHGDLIKVSFEYKDGTVRYIEGTDCAEWEASMNASMVMDFVHGNTHSELMKLKWKEEKHVRHGKHNTTK